MWWVWQQITDATVQFVNTTRFGPMCRLSIQNLSQAATAPTTRKLPNFVAHQGRFQGYV
jgi:hypothetical protein